MGCCTDGFLIHLIKIGVLQGVPVESGSELREDGSDELREDGSIELREN